MLKPGDRREEGGHRRADGPPADGWRGVAEPKAGVIGEERDEVVRIHPVDGLEQPLHVKVGNQTMPLPRR